MKPGQYHWTSELKFTTKNDYDTPVTKPLAGRSVVIYGGGPSLTLAFAAAFKGYPNILTNNAYMLVDQPSVHVALDRRYYQWHGGPLVQAGHTLVTACRPGQHIQLNRNQYYRMEKEREATFPTDPHKLNGTNSGHAACALALLLGAKRLFLLGFDMGFQGQRTHWHQGHVIPASQANYETRFRPRLEKLVKMAGQAGIEITSVTDTQADIPRTAPDDALRMLQHENSMDNSEAPAALSK